MKFTISKGEKTVSELARRIFNLTGPGSKARTREAEAALLAANPQLAALSDLPDGAAVIIPIVPGESLATGNDVHVLGLEAPGLVRNQLRSLREVLNASAGNETESLKASIKTVDRLRGSSSTPEELIDRIEEAAKRRLHDLSTAIPKYKEGFEQLEGDLDSFLTI